jgi:hypothetical protein
MSLDSASQKFFGFSEFLAGLALMVLAWTTADVRYRFRIRSAPLPLRSMTFWVVAVVGLLTLLTDLWRAEGWLVLKGSIISPSEWQAVLALVYLATFLIWAWFAFIRPPRFGKRNDRYFASAMYDVVLRGNAAELSIVADEVTQSAQALVAFATDNTRRFTLGPGGERVEVPAPNLTRTQQFANELLMLIADRRFCHAVVDSSSSTALALFEAMRASEKFKIPIDTFARNILGEALINKNSFLYHEADGYSSGLLGYHQPLSQAMFSSFRMASALDIFSMPGAWGLKRWDGEQWGGFCRLVLMTFEDYVTQIHSGAPIALHSAFYHISRAASDLALLTDGSEFKDSDEIARLRVIVEFIEGVVRALDGQGTPRHVELRIKTRALQQSTYDQIAEVIVELILSASEVSSPKWVWVVQHNLLWGDLFSFSHFDGPAGRIIFFKLRRLLFDEIAMMTEMPNYKGARILSFCLNVLGIHAPKRKIDKGSYPLHLAILRWTRKNFARLHYESPQVAEVCLPVGLSYDAATCRLMKSFPVTAFRREPEYLYFEVVPLPADPSSSERKDRKGRDFEVYGADLTRTSRAPSR